jgi:hypothetical protein
MNFQIGRGSFKLTQAGTDKDASGEARGCVSPSVRSEIKRWERSKARTFNRLGIRER